MVTSLSLPPYNYFVVNFFTFSSFFLFLNNKLKQNRKDKLCFFYGWLFGFGYFITNLYWISISLTFDQNFKFLIPFTIFLIPAFLALFYGLASYLFFILNLQRVTISLLLFSLIFSVIEFLRSSILTGFPWNLIAFSFSNNLEILSIISIIGTYGFNLFCITLFTSPAVLISRNTKKDLLVFVLSIFIFISFYTFGLSHKEKFKYADYYNFDYKIRVVSSNIGLERFYLNQDPASVIKDLIKISNPKENEKTVFIWPEGIVPNTFQENLNEYRKLFSTNFNEKHYLILGINKKQTEKNLERFFNSLSIYDNELNLLYSYDKINLVPFGEFLPAENFLTAILHDAFFKKIVEIEEGENSSRDYISVQQASKDIVSIALNGSHRLYNVASGVNIKHIEIAKILESEFRTKVHFKPNGTTRDLPQVDTSRLRTEFAPSQANVHDNLKYFVRKMRGKLIKK